MSQETEQLPFAYDLQKLALDCYPRYSDDSSAPANEGLVVGVNNVVDLFNKDTPGDSSRNPLRLINAFNEADISPLKAAGWMIATGHPYLEGIDPIEKRQFLDSALGEEILGTISDISFWEREQAYHPNDEVSGYIETYKSYFSAYKDMEAKLRQRVTPTDPQIKK